jgi:hypothetical protein
MPEQIQALPRLGLVINVLSSLPMKYEKCDVIYKGGLYCRWPGCRTVTKYAGTTKLRVHYMDSHHHELPGITSGTLDKHSQQKHIEGILWLTKAALHGVENAGEKPYPEEQSRTDRGRETDCETPMLSY